MRVTTSLRIFSLLLPRKSLMRSLSTSSQSPEVMLGMILTNQRRVLIQLANQKPVLPGDGGARPAPRQPDADEGQWAADCGDHLKWKNWIPGFCYRQSNSTYLFWRFSLQRKGDDQFRSPHGRSSYETLKTCEWILRWVAWEGWITVNKCLNSAIEYLINVSRFG